MPVIIIHGGSPTLGYRPVMQFGIHLFAMSVQRIMPNMPTGSSQNFWSILGRFK